jgi:hypothetical protein
MIERYKAIVAGLLCLLIVGGIQHALAFEVLDSPGGKVVEVKSQEELAQVMKALNLSYGSPIYLVVPANVSLGQMCLSCACDTEHTSEPHANSCCSPDCAVQHRSSCELNNCIWNRDTRHWDHNQCKTTP